MHCHADDETKVGVGRTKDNRQYHAENDRSQSEFPGTLVWRNERLKV